MSSSHELVSVVADSGSPTAAVTIVDRNYKTVAHGVGALEVALSPGLYLARYATGTNVVDKFFEVTAGESTLQLDKPVLSLTSPAPLESSKSGGAHKNLAVELSLRAPVQHGAGSELFVFVRSSLESDEEPPFKDLPEYPANGLKLCNFAGDVIEDFSTLAGNNGCAGLNIALDPGSYILRLEGLEPEALEQTIVTSEGWQTQVFLPLAVLCAADKVRRPALDAAAIFMKPVGTGFRADAEEAAWVEMARTWLARGEPMVPLSRVRQVIAIAQAECQGATNQALLREMLRRKLTNPMLGIFAAHLMMIPPGSDQELLREVLRNLKLLLGDHPDVTPIELWLDENANLPPFDSPPMLRSSWSILVNRSRVDQKLIPPGSYSLRITGRLWGSGVWLVWRTPPQGTKSIPSREKPNDPHILLEYTRRKISGRKGADSAPREIAARNLTSVEAAVLNYITNVALSEAIAGELSTRLEKSGFLPLLRVFFRKLIPSDLVRRARKAAESSVTTDHMIQRLGIPYAALDEAIAGLLHKLEIK